MQIPVPHNPSPGNVIAVRNTLLYFLLRTCGYGSTCVAYCAHHTSSMPAQHFNNYPTARNGHRETVITPPHAIPDHGSILRVIIRTENHDQSWSTTRKTKGLSTARGLRFNLAGPDLSEVHLEVPSRRPMQQNGKLMRKEQPSSSAVA